MKNNFIIAADTHGLLDINKVVNYFDGHENKYSKDDFLIICGDVGVCGFSYFEEQKVIRILHMLFLYLFVDFEELFFLLFLLLNSLKIFLHLH